MIKVKYNWPLDYFDLHNDRMKLVFRILKLSKPDMIQDIHVLVKSSPDIAADAYHYLINRLTELGDFEKCIEVIENVEDKNELCMRSVGVFVAKLDRHEVEQKDLENYLEIVKVISINCINLIVLKILFDLSVPIQSHFETKRRKFLP